MYICSRLLFVFVFWNVINYLTDQYLHANKPQTEEICKAPAFVLHALWQLVLSLFHQSADVEIFHSQTWSKMCGHQLSSSYLSAVFRCFNKTSEKASDLHCSPEVLLLYTDYHPDFSRNMKTALWLLCLFGLALAVRVSIIFLSVSSEFDSYFIYLFIYFPYSFFFQSENHHAREERSLGSNSEEVCQ